MEEESNEIDDEKREDYEDYINLLNRQLPDLERWKGIQEIRGNKLKHDYEYVSTAGQMSPERARDDEHWEEMVKLMTREERILFIGQILDYLTPKRWGRLLLVVKALMDVEKEGQMDDELGKMIRSCLEAYAGFPEDPDERPSPGQSPGFKSDPDSD